MTSHAFSPSPSGSVTCRLRVKVSSHMKIYLIARMRHLFCTSPTRHFIFSFQAAAAAPCLSHQASSEQTEYISPHFSLSLFFFIHFLNNNKPNFRSSVIRQYQRKHSSRPCFAKSMRAQKGTFMSLLIYLYFGGGFFCHKFSHSLCHTHNHTKITPVATRVLCCIAD